MKNFSIVVPAHNEEKFLPSFLKSVCSQNLLPEEMVLIDDNSNDRTKKIMIDFQKKNVFIKVFSFKSSSEHMPGAKVVNAFLFGYSKLTKPYDFIFKLDADLILPDKYFQFIMNAFSNPRIGIVGGILIELSKKGTWGNSHPMKKNHVKGGLKAYSTECYKKIGGLIPEMGWDTIDEILASYHGYEVKVLNNVKVKHLRRIGNLYSRNTSFMQGQAFYKMRYGIIIGTLACIKGFLIKKSLSFLFWSILGLLDGYLKKKPYIVTKQQGQFIRRYRFKSIFRP
ncbi:MAG: glycosyltransferase family 2 protein [Flavobacteriales bacterium TMED96]|nr:MAG: glycosyltransferase family 2 protein [Flavobacteriales bacterium TMED96]